MAEIARGRVSNIGEAGAVIILDSGKITRPLAVPWHLMGEGDLAVDVRVVAALFEDETGIILARTDGRWSGHLRQPLTATDLATGVVPSYNTHRHTGVEEGAGETGGPQ